MNCLCASYSKARTYPSVRDWLGPQFDPSAKWTRSAQTLSCSTGKSHAGRISVRISPGLSSCEVGAGFEKVIPSG
jgi:hypothetical protein